VHSATDTKSLVPPLSQNVSDVTSTSYASNPVRVLWLNWRDINNPEAGGAEVFTHEVMRRLVKKGYEMTLFTSHFLNALRTERIDGINIIRDGGKYTVYSKARNYCKKYIKSYDLVIDEINVRPFLTPKFLKKENKPILALIHQISPEQFLLELPFPLSYIGHYYLEKKWLSYYKDISTLTVSNSTKKDLENLGFRKVAVIPEGLSTTPLKNVPQKESIPTIVFIGRLKRHKLPHHALLAFSSIKKQITDAQLWVIGDGYMLNDLRNKFNVKDVTFYGRVSSDLKFRLLSKSHIVLMPAIREGWGLVVTESNAMGTPVVAYDVPGLRDSIINGETGILTKENSPDSLAKAAICLLKDQALLDEYSYNALSFSRQFSWDVTANAFDGVLRQKTTALLLD
jgi:glycosyltransferase involved in cell wall biosynthesis